MMLPAGTFNSQVAIVTGGGTGLGKAIAVELARLGAKVAITSRSLEHLNPTREEIVAAGGQAMAAVCDVRDPAQVAALFDQVESVLGPVGILVNSAAGNFLVE